MELTHVKGPAHEERAEQRHEDEVVIESPLPRLDARVRPQRHEDDGQRREEEVEEERNLLQGRRRDLGHVPVLRAPRHQQPHDEGSWCNGGCCREQ